MATEQRQAARAAVHDSGRLVSNEQCDELMYGYSLCYLHY
jgi:hypothetical protein